MPSYPTGQPVPPARVTTANIDFENASLDGKFIDFDDTAAVWDEFHVNHRYERDQHTYMMGTTTEAATDPYAQAVGFVQLARPTTLWIVEWKASRMKEKPKIPDFRVGAEWVLLDAIPQTNEIDLGPDGVSKKYTISGTYIYGKRNPARYFTDDMIFPQVPYIDPLSPSERSVDISMLDPGIIQQAGGSITGGLTGGSIVGPFPT